MGDAGPTNPPWATEPIASTINIENESSIREITVLVTGFGPFKSFSTNPSWLIASSLPTILQPQNLTDNKSQSPPYQIRLIVHPSPVRVAYATAASLIPELITTHDPDYIVHIGMAGGRDHYTLETRAHRDSYKIKDIDDRDGWKDGEHEWKKENIPEVLHCGWNEKDVLERWEKDLNERETELGLKDGEKGSEGKSVVRLSRDAGRFLCEFVLMCSLSRRWLEARKAEQGNGKSENVQDQEREDEEQNGSSDPQRDEHRASSSSDSLFRASSNNTREGKAAFFHVPGGHTPQDIVRGTRVAEAVIRSIVGSWEAGKRREKESLGARVPSAGVEKGRWEGVVWKA